MATPRSFLKLVPNKRNPNAKDKHKAAQDKKYMLSQLKAKKRDRERKELE